MDALTFVGLQNLGVQILHVSRMETTYFDMTGQEAYSKKRWATVYILAVYNACLFVPNSHCTCIPIVIQWNLRIKDTLGTI